MMRIEIIDTADTFNRLRPDWDELLRASAADGPFLTWDWLHAWWLHLAGTRRLQIAAVRDGGRLIGLAPFARTRDGLPWLSMLEFLGTGLAGSDYLDLIARRSFEKDCVRELTRWLISQRLAIRLDHLPCGSLAACVADELSDNNNWATLAAVAGTCPFTNLSGHSWDSYLRSLAVSHQVRFRRYVNTLHKKFRVSFEPAQTDAARRVALAALITFHEQRWGQRGGSSAFETAALRCFHEEATRRALECGWLRVHVLSLDNIPAAVTYCFGYNHRFYLYQHGFNASYRQYSVGLVALGLTIRAALEEHAQEFDMLYGREPYKRLWANEERALHRLDLFPDDVRGRIQQRSVTARRALRALARRLLMRNTCDTKIPAAGAVS